MLASRGFVYYSEQSAELYEHEHKHCDCDVIPLFSDVGLVGDTMDMGGIASFSKKKYDAEGYAQDNVESFGGTKVVYVMGKGSKKGADTSKQSVYLYNHEVIPSSKSSQVITRKRMIDGIMYIYVEEV